MLICEVAEQSVHYSTAVRVCVVLRTETFCHNDTNILWTVTE